LDRVTDFLKERRKRRIFRSRNGKDQGPGHGRVMAMPSQLLDPVLDPDTLLAKLAAIEKQREERPGDKGSHLDY
jgi:hypothetical protein